jgi:hypothetical protein
VERGGASHAKEVELGAFGRRRRFGTIPPMAIAGFAASRASAVKATM